MSATIWVSVAGVVVGLLGFLANLIRSSMAHGSDRQRIASLESWQKDRSIDRSEHNDLCSRVADLEGDMKEVAETKTAVAVMSTEMKGFRELVSRDVGELTHSVRNLKAGQDKLTDLFMAAFPRARVKIVPAED